MQHQRRVQSIHLIGQHSPTFLTYDVNANEREKKKEYRKFYKKIELNTSFFSYI